MRLTPKVAMLLIAISVVVENGAGADLREKSEQAISTSLCEILSSPERYQGKLVRFRAQFGGTWEGMYLSDPKCEKAHPVGEDVIVLQSVEMFDDLKIAIPKSARAVKFVNDKGASDFEAASKQLCNAMQECRYDYIEAYMTGVVIVKSGFRIKDGWGNGFGQMGYTKTAFVWQSVANVFPHKCKKSDDSNCRN